MFLIVGTQGRPLICIFSIQHIFYFDQKRNKQNTPPPLPMEIPRSDKRIEGIWDYCADEAVEIIKDIKPRDVVAAVLLSNSREDTLVTLGEQFERIFHNHSDELSDRPGRTDGRVSIPINMSESERMDAWRSLKSAFHYRGVIGQVAAFFNDLFVHDDFSLVDVLERTCLEMVKRKPSGIDAQIVRLPSRISVLGSDAIKFFSGKKKLRNASVVFDNRDTQDRISTRYRSYHERAQEFAICTHAVKSLPRAVDYTTYKTVRNINAIKRKFPVKVKQIRASCWLVTIIESIYTAHNIWRDANIEFWKFWTAKISEKRAAEGLDPIPFPKTFLPAHTVYNLLAEHNETIENLTAEFTVKFTNSSTWMALVVANEILAVTYKSYIDNLYRLQDKAEKLKTDPFNTPTNFRETKEPKPKPGTVSIQSGHYLLPSQRIALAQKRQEEEIKAHAKEELDDDEEEEDINMFDIFDSDDVTMTPSPPPLKDSQASDKKMDQKTRPKKKNTKQIKNKKKGTTKKKKKRTTKKKKKRKRKRDKVKEEEEGGGGTSKSDTKKHKPVKDIKEEEDEEEEEDFSGDIFDW